jgi:hypothetical protein
MSGTVRLDRTMGPYPMTDNAWECLRGRYVRGSQVATTLDVQQLRLTTARRLTAGEVILALCPVLVMSGSVGPTELAQPWDGVERRRRVRLAVGDCVKEAVSRNGQ